MKLNSGYIASALVHGGIVGVSLLAAFLVIPEVRETSGPAEPGTISIVPTTDPQGPTATGGTPASTRPPGLPELKPVDAGKMLEEYERNLRAADAAEAARIAGLNTPKPPRVPVRPVTRPAPVHPSGDGVGVAPVTTPNHSPVRALVPVRVAGPGDGAGPAGAPGGGSPGLVSTERTNAFTQDVRAKFSEAYRPLFREKGSALAANSGAGTVKLFVSPSGIVRFEGWLIRPGETLFGDIVKEAIGGMPTVMPPPGGEVVVVLLDVSGVVTE